MFLKKQGTGNALFAAYASHQQQMEVEQVAQINALLTPGSQPEAEPAQDRPPSAVALEAEALEFERQMREAGRTRVLSGHLLTHSGYPGYPPSTVKYRKLSRCAVLGEHSASNSEPSGGHAVVCVSTCLHIPEPNIGGPGWRMSSRSLRRSRRSRPQGMPMTSSRKLQQKRLG